MIELVALLFVSVWFVVGLSRSLDLVLTGRADLPEGQSWFSDNLLMLMKAAAWPATFEREATPRNQIEPAFGDFPRMPPEATAAPEPAPPRHFVVEAAQAGRVRCQVLDADRTIAAWVCPSWEECTFDEHDLRVAARNQNLAHRRAEAIRAALDEEFDA